ncbi:GrpB family protein [uncultured Methanospirillum sp.]|uniref:GrpB family protein n=1 Tax=uncultured Methanospirillum sp. TaxID=262503 RepID=UPI003747ACC9
MSKQGQYCKLSHYGSTSVPGIIGKPTIDILLKVIDEVDTERLISSFIDIGYLSDSQPRNPGPPYDVYERVHTGGICRSGVSYSCQEQRRLG